MSTLLQYVPFLVNGTFIIASPENKVESIVKVIPKPEADDNSNICKYIRKNFTSAFDLQEMLSEIEADHSANPNIYLSNREVIVCPFVKPATPIERVQIVKNLMKNIFTREQVIASAGAVFVVLNKLSVWEKYIISLIANHFYNLLMCNDYYSSNELRGKMVRKIFDFFVPSSLNPLKEHPFASPVTLLSGKTPFNKSNSLGLVINSSDDIIVFSSDSQSWPKFTADSNCSFNNNKIVLRSNDTGELCEFLINDNVCDSDWCNFLWLNDSIRLKSAESIILSCKAFKGINLSLGEATSLSKVITSFDCNFILSLYKIFPNDSKSFDPLFNSLLNIFISENKELQLIKFIAYYELIRTKDINEMFRKNNNYFRSITMFINRFAKDYKKTTIKRLYELIIGWENWNLKSPTDKDEEIIDKLVKEFFKVLIDDIDNIPSQIRTLCRFLRLLSERQFREPVLVHRPIFAVFILRFVIPSLTATDEFGIQPNPLHIKKVAEFTKVVSYVSQISLRSIDSQMTQLTNNLTVKNCSLVINFYNKLCSEHVQKSAHILANDLIESVSMIRDYSLKHEKEITGFNSSIRHEHIFVDELLTEFVTQSI